MVSRRTGAEAAKTKTVVKLRANNCLLHPAIQLVHAVARLGCHQTHSTDSLRPKVLAFIALDKDRRAHVSTQLVQSYCKFTASIQYRQIALMAFGRHVGACEIRLG